jgi:hypothetical protein
MDHFIWMRERGAEAWTKWRGLISQQTQSGQSAAVFCRERGLRAWLFYAWKKRLREAEAAKFVEVEVKPTERARQWSAPGEQAIEIRISKGRSLVVEPGFDASHLRALLAVLESEG